MKRSRNTVRIAVATTIACGAVAAAAIAAPTFNDGKAQIEMRNVAEPIGGAATNSVAWIPVPNASASVSVPLNATHLFNARFTTESRCFGAAGGYCRVRVVAFNAVTGAVTEFHPQSGFDFQFDTDVPGAADVDLKESHAMERSLKLPAGQYRVRAEWSVNNMNTWFEIDDWHFALESSQSS
jgi:hypothetical protein